MALWWGPEICLFRKPSGISYEGGPRNMLPFSSLVFLKDGQANLIPDPCWEAHDLTEASSQGDFQHNLLHISEPQFSRIHNKNNKT